MRPQVKQVVLLLLLVPFAAVAGDKLRISSSLDAMGTAFSIIAYDEQGEKLEALKILMQLLHANPEDNIGARYAIVALLEGYATYEDFEKKFEKDRFWDTVLLNTWFEAHAPKYKAFIGWWLEWIAEQM